MPLVPVRRVQTEKAILANVLVARKFQKCCHVTVNETKCNLEKRSQPGTCQSPVGETVFVGSRQCWPTCAVTVSRVGGSALSLARLDGRGLRRSQPQCASPSSSWRCSRPPSASRLWRRGASRTACPLRGQGLPPKLLFGGGGLLQLLVGMGKRPKSSN